MLDRSGDTPTHTQPLISKLWMISLQTVLVTVAVHAINGLPDGSNEHIPAR